MSTTDKPDHARGWLYVEKLLDEQKLAEGAAAGTPHESEPGTDPETEWDADDLLARAEKEAAKRQGVVASGVAPSAETPAPPPYRSPVPPAEKLAPVVPIRRSWTAPLLAVACIALFVLFKLRQGPDIVAHPPSDRDVAEGLRGDAEASCARKDWLACKESLDEAAKLDPSGESEARVLKAREEIAAAMGGRSVEAEGGERGP